MILSLLGQPPETAMPLHSEHAEGLTQSRRTEACNNAG